MNQPGRVRATQLWKKCGSWKTLKLTTPVEIVETDSVAFSHLLSSFECQNPQI